MKMIYFLIVIVVQLLLCRSQNPELAKLASDFQGWRLRVHPEKATSLGVYKYNDLISSFYPHRYDDYKTTVDGYHDRLMAITESDLSRADLLTFRMLKSHLGVWLDNYQWKNYILNPISFLEGIQADLPLIPLITPLDTRGDVENYLTRLRDIPAGIGLIKDSMREAMNNNITNHNVSMFAVPGLITKLRGEHSINETFLYKPLKKVEDTSMIFYSAEEKQSLLADARRYIEDIYTSLSNLHTFLQSYATRSSIGVSSFPRGDEFYSSIVKWYLALDLTPQQVHDRGLAEVDRISTLMREIMTKQGFTGTIQEYFQSLMSQPRFTFETADDVLNAYRQIITQEIPQKLPQLFHTLPKLPILVMPMRSDGPKGKYQRGTADGSRPGIFQANVLRPRDVAKFGMMPLALHETVPGHHLQISTAMTSSLPEFRRNLIYDGKYEVPLAFQTFSAFGEGWAVYAEGLGEELGLYKDDYQLMGRYSSEIFRACRLVVDTGIHAFNWDRERAIAYVLNYTANSRATIETEIDRYITWPGQALTYKIGEMKIRELRKKAEDKLGANFDIRDFHQVLLDNGRMPLTLMEENVNYWLDNYTPPQTHVTCAATPSVPGVAAHAFLSVLALIPVFINKILA